jgi:membrane protease YdiL (CAAX protease family)
LAAPLRGSGSLGLAAGAFGAGVILSGILGAVALAFTGDVHAPATLVAGFIGLWIPMVGAAVLASRRYGTGSIARDLGAVAVASDLVRGAIVAVVGLFAAWAVQLLLSPFPRLLGSNTGFINEQKGTFLGSVVIVASTMIGAPLVEELVFRGLLQRALARFGVVAVFVQAAVFAVIHADPVLGVGNIGVVLGVGAFGLVQGFAARHFGRLGPVWLSHSLFNATAVLPLLFK